MKEKKNATVRREEELALACYLRASNDGLRQIDNPEVGKKILSDLAETKSMNTLVHLIQNCLHSEQYLVHLAGIAPTKSDPQSFYRVIATNSKRLVEESECDADIVTDILKKADLGDLFQQCPSLSDEDHPLREKLIDAYWERRIRWFIGRGDLRRAWDELNKARPRIPIQQDFVVADEPHETEGMGRTANLQMLARLVNELFATMVTQDLLSPITNQERERVEHELRSTGSKPVSGIGFAKLFVVFSNSATVASKILAIAKHFSAQKNLRRQQRNKEHLGQG